MPKPVQLSPYTYYKYVATYHISAQFIPEIWQQSYFKKAYKKKKGQESCDSQPFSFSRDYWPTLRDTQLYQIMHIYIQKPFIMAVLDYAIMHINASVSKENPIITPKTRQNYLDVCGKFLTFAPDSSCFIYSNDLIYLL